jgi:hypothetical protein
MCQPGENMAKIATSLDTTGTQGFLGLMSCFKVLYLFYVMAQNLRFATKL